MFSVTPLVLNGPVRALRAWFESWNFEFPSPASTFVPTPRYKQAGRQAAAEVHKTREEKFNRKHPRATGGGVSFNKLIQRTPTYVRASHFPWPTGLFPPTRAHALHAPTESSLLGPHKHRGPPVAQIESALNLVSFGARSEMQPPPALPGQALTWRVAHLRSHTS